jgi:hypothetical protein
MRELQLLRWAISSKLTEFAFLPGSLGRGWQKRRHVAGNFYSDEVSEAVSPLALSLDQLSRLLFLRNRGNTLSAVVKPEGMWYNHK